MKIALPTFDERWLDQSVGFTSPGVLPDALQTSSNLLAVRFRRLESALSRCGVLPHQEGAAGEDFMSVKIL